MSDGWGCTKICRIIVIPKDKHPKNNRTQIVMIFNITM